MTKLPQIDYYFDVLSPYAYIGFEILQKMEPQWKGVTIRYIPYSLRKVMIASGNQPPALLAARGRMLITDIQRMAKFWDIPLTPPPQFMEWLKKYTTIQAMQLMLVLEEQDRELMLRAAREMWLRLWSRNEKIFEEEDFMETLKAVGAKNPEELIEKSNEDKYVKKLDENSKAALDTNAYGSPWINVHTSDGQVHSFFGSDRFNLIADMLGLPQPLPERLS